MMKKLVLGAAVASAVMAAAPAHAALVSYTASGTTSFADPATGDSSSSSFSDNGIGSGSFTDTLKFTTGITGETIAAITITAFSHSFSSFSATLNGITLTPNLIPGNIRVYAIDVASLVAGTQTLVISGSSLGHAGYSGSISAPIPEPSTWALSILGLGLIGGMLRSRRQTQRQQSGALAAA
jgi:hypothetical protein